MRREKAMPELKEIPKPKTENGAGQTRDISPLMVTAPLKSDGSLLAFLRRFAHQMGCRFGGFLAGRQRHRIRERFAREMEYLFENLGLESGRDSLRCLSRRRELLRRQGGLILVLLPRHPVAGWRRGFEGDGGFLHGGP